VAAVNAFLTELSTSPQDEKVAICTYNNVGTTDVALTNDYTLISTAMAGYTASFCSGGTNIGGGIDEGFNAVIAPGLERSWAAKVLVVMTDGIHNTGSDPEDAAEDAADEGVMVFTVTLLGTDGQRGGFGGRLGWQKTRKTGEVGTRRCRAIVACSATLPPGGSDAVAAGEGKGDNRGERICGRRRERGTCRRCPVARTCGSDRGARESA